MLDPALSLEDLELKWTNYRKKELEQSPTWKFHKDRAEDIHGLNTKELKLMCCNTKAKCQDEA